MESSSNQIYDSKHNAFNKSFEEIINAPDLISLFEAKVVSINIGYYEKPYLTNRSYLNAIVSPVMGERTVQAVSEIGGKALGAIESSIENSSVINKIIQLYDNSPMEKIFDFIFVYFICFTLAVNVFKDDFIKATPILESGLFYLNLVAVFSVILQLGEKGYNYYESHSLKSKKLDCHVLELEDLLRLGLNETDIQPLKTELNLLKTKDKAHQVGIKILLNSKGDSEKPELRIVFVRDERNIHTKEAFTFDSKETGIEYFPVTNWKKERINEILKRLETQATNLVDNMWQKFMSVRSLNKSHGSVDFNLMLGFQIGHDKSKKSRGSKAEVSTPQEEIRPLSKEIKPIKGEPKFLSLAHQLEFMQWLAEHQQESAIKAKFEDLREGIDAKPLDKAIGLFEIKKGQWRIYYHRNVTANNSNKDVFTADSSDFTILCWGHKDEQQNRDIPKARKLIGNMLL